MKAETAKKLARQLAKANENLGRAVKIVQEGCSEREFFLWRAKIAKVLGSLFLDALDPLYRKNPQLAPLKMRAMYSETAVIRPRAKGKKQTAKKNRSA